MIVSQRRIMYNCFMDEFNHKQYSHFLNEYQSIQEQKHRPHLPPSHTYRQSSTTSIEHNFRRKNFFFFGSGHKAPGLMIPVVRPKPLWTVEISID